MKKIFLFLLTFFFFTQSSYAILKVTKLPYKDAEIERIYKLDNGKYIFIEQWGRGDVIWEYDPFKDEFKEISKVWTFIELANKCEMIDSENIYFAKHNKDKSNSLLRSYGSPYRFSKQPRTGFTIVFDNLMNGNDVYVFGFSIKNEERISYYVESEFESPVHEMKDEINILRWLHKNNKIDATLCMLVDTDIPTLDCEGGLRPNLKTLNKIVEMFGRCRLINYEIMKEDSMLESLKNFNIEIGETIDILKK